MVLAGCVDEVDVFQPIDLSSGDINRFFESVQSNPIDVSWDASQEQTIQLPGSGRVIVPANSLLAQDGTPVSGMVQAKVLPLYNKSDYLLNRMATTSVEGALIRSNGAIDIRITQDGVPLRVKGNKPFTVQLATARYNANMRLFEGEADEVNGVVNWIELNFADTPINAIELTDDKSGEKVPGFEFESKRLGRLLCGQYVENELGEGEVCLNVPQNFLGPSTIVFITIDDYPSVAVMLPSNADNLPDYCRWNLPAGESAKVIMIAEQDSGKYFFAEQTVPIMENLTISIEPEEASLSDIMLALEGL